MMKSQNTTGSSSSSPVVMSMEAVFVGHYMDALSSLQQTWLGPDGLNSLGFGVQIEYLIRLIPDRELQKKIQTERVKLQSEFSQEQLDHPNERAALYVVTHLIEFICNSFDLLHVDIIGPGVNGQYQQSVVEIPDMDKPTTEPDLIEATTTTTEAVNG